MSVLLGLVLRIFHCICKQLLMLLESNSFEFNRFSLRFLLFSFLGGVFLDRFGLLSLRRGLRLVFLRILVEHKVGVDFLDSGLEFGLLRDSLLLVVVEPVTLLKFLEELSSHET